MLFKIFLLEISSFFLLVEIQIIQAWNPIRSNKPNDLTALDAHPNYRSDIDTGTRSEEVESKYLQTNPTSKKSTPDEIQNIFQ